MHAFGRLALPHTLPGRLAASSASPRRLQRLALLAAPFVLAVAIVPLSSATADAATSLATNCGVNLRARPSTSSTIKHSVPTDTVVGAIEKVSGGSWKADCGRSVSGSSWFKITSVNGKSVSSLYGVSAVYAATGLFRSATASTPGIDVSSWQGAISWSKVKAAGKKFVIAKADEGNSWTDPRYASNRSGAMAAGLKFTGYHFARPGTNANDAVSEADHFVSVLGLKHGMLVPALDLEVSGGLSVSALQSWTRAFVTRVYNRLGVRVSIYTTASFWSANMGNTAWFGTNGYRVWIARWGVSSPSVPASNWAGHGWTLWQYSDCGTVSGISGCVDLDHLKGTSLTSITY
ncbi:MAG TPA: GH25 family lysozyme [Candidatus Limnocylindrales bacterium]|nr:GH25 family lysozyme [Candidatus Limnocylindrales bacterium]